MPRIKGLLRNPFDRFAMDFVFAHAPRGLNDFRLIHEQINRKSYYIPFSNWPRISPALLAEVWMLK